MLRLYFASSEVDIGQSVELGHHDVYVIRTDSGRKYRNARIIVNACRPYEFARCTFALECLEVRLEHRHPTRVTYEDDVTDQLLRTDVKMENVAVRMYGSRWNTDPSPLMISSDSAILIMIVLIIFFFWRRGVWKRS